MNAELLPLTPTTDQRAKLAYVYIRQSLCWLLRSSVQKNGFSGDFDGGYLFVLEDRNSLVKKFNSHPFCLSSFDKLSLSPQLYSSRRNSLKERN
jgi:hypothetical protein